MIERQCCGAIQHNAHGEYDHRCIGEPGHGGDKHWCLLGHVWPVEEEDE